MRSIFTKKRGKTGFTLIELLITITIIGIISITTFSIVISTMNTFQREQDLLDANAFKDEICLIVKGHLRKRVKMTLVNQNLNNTEGYYPDKPSDIKINQTDSYGTYIEDPRLKELHMLYTDNGRIYTVDSNPECKYYIGAQVDINATSVLPTSTLTTDNRDPKFDLQGQYGRKPYMTDDLYRGYYVDLRFRPLKTNIQGRYRDLQIIVTIYDDAAMTEEHQVAKGTETFHLLNIEAQRTTIYFYNDKEKYKGPKTHDEPILDPGDGFRICYFA